MELDRLEKELFAADDFSISLSVSSFLQDAPEPFEDINVFVHAIHRWIKEYPKEYEQCFVHLSLPDLLEMYIRIELLQWAPHEVFLCFTHRDPLFVSCIFLFRNYPFRT